MSDNAAKFLSGAIVVAALVYLLTHLHATASNHNNTVVYNTVTGDAKICLNVRCE